MEQITNWIPIFAGIGVVLGIVILIWILMDYGFPAING